MGAYDSYFTGRFDITPPLSWAEIRNFGSPGLRALRLKMEETTTDTATGRTTAIRGAAVLPLTSSPYSGAGVEAELQALVDAHPSHEFTGVISARPEDPSGDPWRYVIRDRRVVRQVPVSEWQDAP